MVSPSSTPPTRPRVIGFSGHRHLAHPGTGQAITDALAALCGSEGRPPLSALSSTAIGADFLFLEACEQLRVPVEILLPFPVEEFARDFTPEEWKTAEAHLARAAQTRIFSGEERPGAYLTCGKAIVKGCDLFMVLWNGEPAAGVGGTAELVAHARELGRPLLWIEAQTLEIRRERFPV